VPERTDCHRPAELDPATYKYVGWIYQGHSEEVLEAIHGAFHNDPTEIDPEKVLKSKRLFDGHYKVTHTCDHCGARFHWGNVYLHRPTRQIIVVGHICASRFHLESRSTWIQEQVRRQKETNERRNAIIKAAREWLNEHQDLISVLGEEAQPTHYILADLKRNLFQWGHLTDKQVELAHKIVTELNTPKIEKPKVDVVEGDGITITGIIISTKVIEGMYGYEHKMLVEDDRGFRVWGTIPSKIDGCEAHGDKITFIANIEKSTDDPSFGFFKRPRKAQILERVEEATSPQPAA